MACIFCPQQVKRAPPLPAETVRPVINAHLIRLSEAEVGLRPVVAERANILTEAPFRSHMMIGATGKMAVMHTIFPVTFVEFKRWLAERPNRESPKRRRDALQAQTVQSLMDEGLLL